MKKHNMTQEFKNNSCFSNWSIKELDDAVAFALGISIVFGVFAEPKVTINELSVIFVGMTLFLSLVPKILFAKSLKMNRQYTDKTYQHNINDLLLAMYKEGLQLKSWGDDLYVFSTRNRILPNNNFVIRDCGEYCSILGQENSLNTLERLLSLKVK